jgi:hypothetical protein
MTFAASSMLDNFFLFSRRRTLVSLLAISCLVLSGSVSAFSLPAATANSSPTLSKNDRIRTATKCYSSNPAYIISNPLDSCSEISESGTSDKNRKRNSSNSIGDSNLRLPWQNCPTEYADSRVNQLFPKSIKQQDREEYERRKEDWIRRYTHVESLRETFGRNRNLFWGDLDATTSRRLYKTLLPRALLEMHRMGGVQPHELAPLAFQARLAAKLYARERCVVPARFCAATFDGYRQWRRYGTFQPSGMTYPQVWDKYEAMILKELDQEGQHVDELSNEDLTTKICLKILERSCHTNEGIDRLLLKESQRSALKEQEESARKEHDKDLATVIDQLESDVRELLQPYPTRHEREWKASRIQTLRVLVRAKKRLDFLDRKIAPSLHRSNHHHKKK